MEQYLPDNKLSETSFHGTPQPPICLSTAIINPPLLLAHNQIPSLPLMHKPTSSLPPAQTLAPLLQAYQHPLPPPVPAHLCSRILQGRWVCFYMLLPCAMFSVRNVTSCHQQHLKTFGCVDIRGEGRAHNYANNPAVLQNLIVQSMGCDMEYLCLYSSFCKPFQALELFGCQKIITSSNLTLSLIAWFKYDKRLRTVTQLFSGTLSMLNYT